jgi:hypothetical protein
VATADDGTVTVTLHPKRPGTHTETVRVSADVRKGDSWQMPHEDFVITYVVADNPAINALYVPTEIVGVTTQGNNTSLPGGYYVLGNTGVNPWAHTVEYLTNPPAADGHPQVHAWYYQNTNVFLPCYNTISSSDCLPPGEYTARIPFEMIVNDSTIATEYLPVKMTIQP